MPEYRIKEVEVGLNENDIQKFFYPQVLDSRMVVSRWKFWKKDKVVEDWRTFEHNNHGINGAVMSDKIDNLSTAVGINHVVFNALDQAQDWLKLYDERFKKSVQDYKTKVYRGIGANASDKEIGVKFHPVAKSAEDERSIATEDPQ